MKTPPKPPPAQPPSSKPKSQHQNPEESKGEEIAFGPDAETWTLNFTSSISGNMPGAFEITTITTKTSGSATLKIDAAGRLMGSGTMSVVETVAIPPNQAARINPATGQGRFTVTGKRDGQYLILSFDRGDIPLKGTMTVAVPTGTQTVPRTSSFDPSTAVPTPTTVDRKEGGTSTAQIKAGPITGTTALTLSGGTNVVKETPPPKGTFPKEKNIWTLEFQFKANYEINTAEIAGTGQWTFDGKVEFPLPLDDGPAKGEGPMTLKGSTTMTKPKPIKQSISSNWVLILDGKIEKDVLTFGPRAKFETAQASQGAPPYSVSANFGEGLWGFDPANQVSIPVKNGAEVVENVSFPIQGGKCDGKAIWRLKGKKDEEQTWRVLLSGQETDDIGGKLMYMKVQEKWAHQVVGYGVRFDYKLTAEFTIRKKEGQWVYKNGTITAANVKATHVFDPAVFFVKDEKAVCKNCQEVDALAGRSLSGDLDGNTVRLRWPGVIARAVVYNKLKLKVTSTDESREETLKGYSANMFESECFFGYAREHNLPLKDGELPKPFAEHRKSYVDQFRQKGKAPINVYHRYVMKRIR